MLSSSSCSLLILVSSDPHSSNASYIKANTNMASISFIPCPYPISLFSVVHRQSIYLKFSLNFLSVKSSNSYIVLLASYSMTSKMSLSLFKLSMSISARVFLEDYFGQTICHLMGSLSSSLTWVCRSRSGIISLIYYSIFSFISLTCSIFLKNNFR